jgi:hypothetical protein
MRATLIHLKTSWHVFEAERGSMDDTLSKAIAVLNVTLCIQPLAAASTSAVAKLRVHYPACRLPRGSQLFNLRRSLCFNLPTSKTAFDNLIDAARIANLRERIDVNRLRGTQGSAKLGNARSRGQCYQSLEEHPHTRVVDPACSGPPIRQTRSLVGRQSESYRFDPSWPPRVLA